MKKRFKFTTSILLISILLFAFFSLRQNVYAADTKTYNISNYNINITIKSDGSADIEENLTYNYSGQFNGVLRDIDFSKTDGLINQRVYVIKDGDLKEWKLNASNSLDYAGIPGTYNFVKEGTLARFKIFEPSYDEEKTFVIKYTLLNVVTKYNDIAEFNRKMIDTRWQTSLNNISIKLTLPGGAAKEDIRVFAHGPLTGEAAIIDASNVLFKVPAVSKGTFVETLVIFPPKLVALSKNIVNENALQGILENEKSLAEEANRARYEARRQVQKEQQNNEQQLENQARLKTVGNLLSILLMIAWFPLIVYIYVKYDKEPKSGFQGKYYRELPGEYTPAEMSVLMSFGSVNTRDIMATLMDLVRIKQLLLASNKVYKKNIFGSKEISQYSITLNEKAPMIPLKKHEQFLISWFIGKIGSGASVTLDEIRDYVKSRQEALQFKSDYETWSKLAKEEAFKNKFFDETSKKGSRIGILSGIAFLGVGAAATVLMYSPYALIPAVQGLFMIIFSARIKRRTLYGSEQHLKWNAFKSFLKEFSRLDKAIIPSIVIWEHYLVYAISLGVAKEVIKQLPIIFRDDDLNNNQLTFMYGASYGYFAGFSTMFYDTIHTVDGAVSTAESIANSVNSSSSGGGGGFSGGSSGGGGGGGGGGAF